MARPLRIEFPGALYHVTSRGNDRKDIYLDNGDRKLWLNILQQVCERFSWIIHAYCQMGNHFHMLVETPDGNLAKGMRQLNGVYTQRFNQKYGRVGHVYQGRYKAILVQKDAYLLELSRYIVLNPTRAGMVRTARDWAWSNYRATAGMTAKPDWLQIEWILGIFSKNKRDAQNAYRRFVSDGRNNSSPWENLKHQIYLGSAEFVKEMQSKVDLEQYQTEIPKKQVRPVARPLSWYFEQYKDRDRAICEAFRSGAYSMKVIGDHVGLHYSRISRIISKAKAEESNNKT